MEGTFYCDKCGRAGSYHSFSWDWLCIKCRRSVMKIRPTIEIDINKLLQMAVIYLFDNKRPSRTGFEKFVRSAVIEFGLEGCGMHSENGYCDHTYLEIEKAATFLLQNFKQECNGVAKIWKYNESQEYEIVFTSYSWETREVK